MRRTGIEWITLSLPLRGALTHEVGIKNVVQFAVTNIRLTKQQTEGIIDAF